MFLSCLDWWTSLYIIYIAMALVFLDSNAFSLQFFPQALTLIYLNFQSLNLKLYYIKFYRLHHSFIFFSSFPLYYLAGQV